ncbi:hypothetical protein C8R45DRAFT_479952 [Mycena sanguinolenta]|nr:hypothetical protein C8R45DRAFT_479952 [Mycena sanguinolenta]
MASRKLVEAFNNAQRLREICEVNPSLNVYRRIATLTGEVCASATPDTRRNVSALALHAVKRTKAVIENEVCIPMSPERKQVLEKFESTLDRIRQHAESIPERGTKLPKFGLSAVKYHRKSRGLKAELDQSYKVLTSKTLVASQNEYILPSVLG